MKSLTLKRNQSQIILDLGDRIKLPPNVIHMSKDSKLEYYFFWKNASVDRELVIHLNEEGASAKLIGLFYARDDERINLNSTIVHHAPNTYGNTLVKGALKNSSRAKLSGMIKIDPGAQGSDDLLTERVLLLSPQARAEAVPMLEIEANEVKATHAATISRLNKDHLYYLQSRGLPTNEAEKFIVEGFLQEVIDQLPKKLNYPITQLPITSLPSDNSK